MTNKSVVEDDIFAELDRQIAGQLEIDARKKRAKELEAQAKSNRLAPAKKQQVVKELAELRETLEAAKWRVVAVELVCNHVTCKNCGTGHQQPDGIFIQRETIARPLVTSRRRINLPILRAQYLELPRRRLVIARQIDLCTNCADSFGWTDATQSDVVIINQNETITMSATEFFGE